MYLQTTLSNNFLSGVVANGVGTGISSPTVVINAADVGKLLHVSLVYDAAAGKVRLYLRRIEQSTGTVIVGHTAATGALSLLRHAAGSLACPFVSVFGACMGASTPTLAEIQAEHDACMAAEDIVAIPGRTAWLVSVKQDAGAGLVAPAQLTDRIGVAHLTKGGSPAIVAQYARAWGW
jgi:hypothetical protein